MKLTTAKKIGITIILALLYVWLCGCSNPVTYAAGEKTGYAPNVGKLTDFYREANRTLFYGGLPEARTTIRFGELADSRDRMAEIDERMDGSWVITIDPKVHAVETQAELSILHEMCHQKNFIRNEPAGIDGHSYMFQRCMQDIADRDGLVGIW